MRAGWLAPAALGVLALTVSGCESSQDTSARLQKAGAHAIAAQHGLVITTRNRDVRVVEAGVVTDSNGTAAAVMLQNIKPTPVGLTPVAIDVVGVHGKSVFKNNSPGLESSLTSVAALPPRGSLTWVNDQVVPAGGKATGVRAEVGAGGAAAALPVKLPEIAVSPPRLITDPVSGLEATGTVTNRSSVAQLKLFVYIAAWLHNRLVAAGRGAIARLAPRGHSTYHVFLIGNPSGASLTVAAPPTVLK